MINITKIYLVTNIDNDPNKVYIGKTINSRFAFHRRRFGSQITYDYIDEVNSLNHKDWKPLESYWILQFKAWGFNVVNKNDGGSGAEYYSEEIKQKLRGPKSNETKIKMSLAKLGKPSTNPQKPIMQYDLQGNFIREWNGIREVSKHLNISCGNIPACCKGKLKSHAKFIWKYKEAK